MVQIAENRMTAFSSSSRFATQPNDRIERITQHLEPDHEKTRLANQLASEFWSRLAFAPLADETGHRSIEQIVRIAAASHSQIVAWHTELHEFVDAICQAAIELRGGEDITDAFREQLTREIKERITADGSFALPPRSFIDFRFADLDPAIAMDEAERQLEQLCLQIANQLFALLEHLQQQKLIGSINAGDSTCRFTFFRRVALLDRQPTRPETRTTVDPRYADHWHKAYFVKTYDTAKVEIQHRHALHVHHVRNPVLRKIGETKHPLPHKYQQLVESCPDWIRPSLRVIEGELFREEQVEWDTLSETRPDEQLVSTRWERCPAIIFDSYVLAGWGEQAIAAEENRVRELQSVDAKQNCLATAKQYQTAMSVLALLAITIMLFSWWATAAITSMAILTGLGAMFMASQAAHFALIARDRFSTSRVLVHTLLIGWTVFAIQAGIFSALHLSLPALLLAALFAVAAWIVFTVKTKHEELDGYRVD